MLDELWPLLICPGVPFAGFLGWVNWFAAKKKREWKKPFDEMPRPAGWSLQEKIEKLNDRVIFAIWVMMGGGGLFGVMGMLLPHRAIFLGLGFVLSSFMALRLSRLALRMSRYRDGLRGEQCVGQILDQLTSPQLRVFHDLLVEEPGRKPWNIDHIVVMPEGVFAIETKCRRKPLGGAKEEAKHKVTYDGRQLLFPEPLKATAKPVEQARNAGAWLSRDLGSQNGMPVAVQAVLVLPGWWVDAAGKGDVSVLNPKMLGGYFGNRRAILTAQQLNAICGQLEKRCRIEC